MRAAYGKTFITNLVLGNPTTCVYQFVIGKSNEHPVVITRFFIFNGLGPCVHFQVDVAHMFYGWKFSHCAAATFKFQKDKSFLCVDGDTTIFAWGASK